MLEIILIIIALSVLIIAHEAGHFFSAKFFRVRVDEFGIGFPPRVFGKKIGKTLYSINALPLGGFVKIFGEHGPSEDTPLDDKEGEVSFSSISLSRRAVILLGGIIMNIIVGWMLLSAVLMIGIPFHLGVNEIVENSPAASAGISPGDFILEISRGSDILYDPISPEDFKEFIAASGENEVNIVIQRGEEEISVSLQGRVNPPEGEGSLGVSISMFGVPREGFFSALVHGARETADALGTIVKGFYHLLSNIFSSPEIAKDLSGPVGIVMIAKWAGDMGFVFFLQLMALISLNLAIFNLIPFPALDGGRVVLLLVEWITRSPVSDRVQTAINAGGLLLLLALMIFVTIQDVGRFF
jgi:regulator of sigma E protease